MRNSDGRHVVEYTNKRGVEMVGVLEDLTSEDIDEVNYRRLFVREKLLDELDGKCPEEIDKRYRDYCDEALPLSQELCDQCRAQVIKDTLAEVGIDLTEDIIVKIIKGNRR